MSPEIMRARLLSESITDNYFKLMILASDNDEESVEFNEIIKKIKKTIVLEKEAYNEISLLDIDTFFANYDYEDKKALDIRMFERLQERKALLIGEIKNNDGILLKNVFNCKMTIDTYKLIRSKILAIKKEYENDERFKQLIFYHHISKFSLFTSNSYMEDYILKYNFDIKKTPSIKFEEINKLFSIDTLELLSESLSSNICDELDSINQINNRDQILNTYSALSALSRIEVSLNCLNQNQVKNIINKYQSMYGDSKKEPLITAKKLIKNRLNKFK